MFLYKNQKDQLDLVKEKPFKLEKELQQLAENNLEKLFGLEFVASERKIGGLYIDTLAFDPNLKTFVIIEYKRSSSFSVVDQGFSYLSLLLNNKSDFVLEYNETKNKSLKRDDIDWTQVKIIFVANSFTNHQINAVNFKNIPFELWEVTRFDNDLISFNQIDQNKSSETIPSLDNKDVEVKKFIKEKKDYSENNLIKNKKTEELYKEFLDSIKDFSLDLNFVPTKYYIGLQKKGNWRVIVYISFYKEKIKLEFARTKSKDLSDPDKKLKDSADWVFKRRGQHISYFEIENKDDLEYGLFLTRQAIKRFEKEFLS